MIDCRVRGGVVTRVPQLPLLGKRATLTTSPSPPSKSGCAHAGSALHASSGAIGDSQLCCLRFNGIVEEDTTMCLLDEGDHRSP